MKINSKQEYEYIKSNIKTQPQNKEVTKQEFVDFCNYYTRNPDKFVKNVLGVKLHWYQLMMLRIMARCECAKGAVKRWIWRYFVS